MEPDELRLSRIQTLWTAMFRAHREQDDEASRVRNELLMRYHGAVYRYLLRLSGEPAVAEELTQQFALRFLEGRFAGADPSKGRFRDYLKTALRHLVRDSWRQPAQTPGPLPEAIPGAREPDPADEEFLIGWREELLSQAWQALAGQEQQGGPRYHTVLRERVKYPDLSISELANRLSGPLGKQLSESALRQLLHRARRQFAALLVEEVGRSLPGAEPEVVAEELIEVGLFRYCRPALEGQGRHS